MQYSYCLENVDKNTASLSKVLIFPCAIFPSLSFYLQTGLEMGQSGLDGVQILEIKP